MSYVYLLATHIALGSAAILIYWVPLLARKGSPVHRAAGRAFFVMMGIAALSVGPVLFVRPGAFDPALIIQFVYLTLCVVAVCTVALTAIRWKDDIERFRGLHFKVLAGVIFILGIVVLAAGLAGGNLLTVVFSWVGLVYGGAMLQFAWMRAEPHPRWWLGWHLNAVAGLFNAAHGTFLAVAWRHLVDPAAGDEVSIAMQFVTIAGALGLRVWFGRKYNVPWRFSRRRQPPVAAMVVPEG